MMTWVWAIILALSLIIEFLSMQMVCIWLALGALVGMILAIIGGIQVEIQIVVVIVISLLAIIFLRKFALKYLNNSSEEKKADILIGKKTKLLSKISKDTAGLVKINGISWTVFADKDIDEGTEVEIIEIQGNKLKVK